jgi:hypothetical protein
VVARIKDNLIERRSPKPSLKILSCITFAALFLSNVLVLAEDKSPRTCANCVISFGDLMSMLQLRHAKLWYAAAAGNWPLAEYQLGELVADLKEFYASVPASGETDADKLAALIGETIKAKDRKKFDASFDQLTAACNHCHETNGRAYIRIRRPPLPSPFSNQIFGPR